MNLKQQLKEAIEAAIKKAELVDKVPEIKVEVPKDKKNGDFSTNAAMMLTKLARKNPRDIAEAIIENIDKEAASIKEVSIAGPGFINFKMETAELANVIYTVLDKKGNYGRTERETAEKVLIEFVSANPTGDLHIGHARNASVGATLSNIMDFAGYDVTREYYINDAGNQINNLAKSIEARYFEALGDGLNMPEDGYNGKDIKVIGEKLASEHPEYKDLEEAERISKFRDLGVEYEMRKLKADLEEFRIKFDSWFSETALYESGEIDEAMTKMKDNGYVFEADDATWLRTTDFKDDKDRVLVKSDGTLTYLMPDIAYHYDKVERGYDKLINLFGADHHGYINRLKASLGALGENPDKLEIQIMQLVRLIENGEEVKMSKRTGKAVTLRDLIDMIGVDAARYFMIMRSTDTHFDFDLDLARSESSDNPVYYAQYAHARICSILRQAKEQGFEIDKENPVDIIEQEQALELLKKVLEFPNIVKGAAESRATQRIPNYIHDLAASFHKFYNAEKVLGENADKTRAYILMIEAVRQTLENALGLIDVSAPEKM
ncbi:arginine--tRNA ligase [Jeotgalicoccus nanhaiensis]|uniref:Arginine--tRNA ligase n=1 Tax=Jeotgalicoccus nanhaiensis TaxID=568603 RepID=A0ABR9Y0B0_9STAP|nr:arginine--tRNA ligase [Jeotgalicoccus nanhaiensis]MBF0754431.1 arginine--tRNA ligase [Jeotgalicoccus nanhaiensis]TFU61137.1 arginine--tRNA ligase [Jeotgalicoccus nanhaiensis]